MIKEAAIHDMFKVELLDRETRQNNWFRVKLVEGKYQLSFAGEVINTFEIDDLIPYLMKCAAGAYNLAETLSKSPSYTVKQPTDINNKLVDLRQLNDKLGIKQFNVNDVCGMRKAEAVIEAVSNKKALTQLYLKCLNYDHTMTLDYTTRKTRHIKNKTSNGKNLYEVSAYLKPLQTPYTAEKVSKLVEEYIKTDRYEFHSAVVMAANTNQAKTKIRHLYMDMCVSFDGLSCKRKGGKSKGNDLYMYEVQFRTSPRSNDFKDTQSCDEPDKDTESVLVSVIKRHSKEKFEAEGPVDIYANDEDEAKDIFARNYPNKKVETIRVRVDKKGFKYYKITWK